MAISAKHEALTGVLQEEPSAIKGLIGIFPKIKGMPDDCVPTVGPTDLTDWKPGEFRADRTVVFQEGTNPPSAWVVEVQLDRDRRKHTSWPVYVSMARHRLKCQTALVVICLDEPIAKWCAQPIETGHPGWDLEPLVAGPHNLPAVVDVAHAQADPFMAVLSATVHCEGPEGVAVLTALAQALPELSGHRGTTYAEVARALLPPDRWKQLEETMTITHPHAYSDFGRNLVATERVRTRTEDILKVLNVRQLPVSDDARARIMSCTDDTQLAAWLQRAATATSTNDLFD